MYHVDSKSNLINVSLDNKIMLASGESIEFLWLMQISRKDNHEGKPNKEFDYANNIQCK